MSYHVNPVINDLVLAVINDGNGSECGMTYDERCKMAEFGILYYRAACKRYSERRVKVYEVRKATRAEIIEAASIIQEYYRQHIKEQSQPSGCAAE